MQTDAFKKRPSIRVVPAVLKRAGITGLLVAANATRSRATQADDALKFAGFIGQYFRPSASPFVDQNRKRSAVGVAVNQLAVLLIDVSQPDASVTFMLE